MSCALCNVFAGPVRCAEEMAPVAGQALHPRPRGQSHVHPHLADTRQLPQHQAVHGCLRRKEALARAGSQRFAADPLLRALQTEHNALAENLLAGTPAQERAPGGRQTPKKRLSSVWPERPDLKAAISYSHEPL